MPIANIVIILFVLAMIYMGTVQGLFSSFLHLIVVVAAGTLAFALWEPLTLSLLIKFMPLFAWTLGLLVPFGVLLLVLRMVTDKLIPGNTQFPGIVNLLVGAACGGVSGLLTAGIAVIGIGFLPIGPDLAGYQPYSVGAGGRFQQTGDKLWIPVNSIASNFFGGLSRGAFASSTPMAEYKPDLELQMSLIRVRPEYVSIVASPEAVELTGAYIADTANLIDTAPADLVDVMGEPFRRAGMQLVIVDTEWSTVQNTVDGDRALRLPSSHVRLIARAREGKDVELIGPIGFSKPIGDGRVFFPYDSEAQMAFSTAPTSTFGFVYLVPGEFEPLFPQVRMMHLTMPDDDEIVSDPEEVLAALGVTEAPEAEPAEGEEADAPAAQADKQTNIGDRTGIRAGSHVLDVQITNSLPTPTSKNTISGLSVTDGDKGAMIVSGSTGSARKPTGSIGGRNKIAGFDIPPHEAMIRVKVTGDQNTSLFGAGLSSAAALNPIFLEDSSGNKWFVTAYVWYKADKSQDIHFDAFSPIRSAKQMPISRMDKEDAFYLYFSVTKPATITRYSIGDVSSQDFEPPLEVK